MYCMAYLSPFRAVRSVVPLQARGLLAPQVRQFSYRSQNYYQGSWGKKRNFIYPGIAALTATGVLISSRDDMTISKGRKIEVASSTANKEGSRHTGSSTTSQKAGTWKESLPVYTYDQVLEHDSSYTGVWVTYKDGVYDITNFVSQHPGGDLLLVAAGKAIDSYWTIYNIHNNNETYELLESMRIGNFDRNTAPKDEDIVVEDQWKNEPKSRHPVLHHNQERPFNAEPPPAILTAQFLTPNDFFYVRNHLPVPPKIKPNEYRLEVTKEGIVGEPRQLSLDDIKKLPHHTISATLQCAGNRRSNMSTVKQVRGMSWGISAIGNATWTGVRLRDVLKQASENEDDFKQFKHVQFEGFDQDALGSCYGASIPIETAMNPQSDVLLAFEMNGEELPMDHGYPLRVIVPGTIGARSVKWLSRIILSSEESPSSWQRRDYKLFPANIDVSNVDFNSSQAMQEMPVQSAICSPMPGSNVKVSDGVVNIRGYAYSGGGRAISRVDVSINGGKEWHTANLIHEPEQKYNQAWAWTLWEVTIAIPENYVGDLDLCCKALDSSCNTQPEKAEDIWNFRGLANNSWHHVPIKVVDQ